MRACAREVGMSAIQSASVERSLEEHLAGERKALLAALHRPGAKSVRDIAAGEPGSTFLRGLCAQFHLFIHISRTGVVCL
jgi:hypothetical protein